MAHKLCIFYPHILLKTQKTLSAFAAIISAGMLTAPAQASDFPLSVGMEVGMASEYIWRGQKVADYTVHPNINVGYAVSDQVSLGFDFWAALPTESGSPNEFDYLLSLSFQINDQLSATVGGTLYHFTAFQNQTRGQSIYESFVMLDFAPSLDSPLSLTLAYFREFGSENVVNFEKMNYLELSGGFNFPVANDAAQLDFEGELGYAFQDSSGGRGEYYYYGVFASVRYILTANLELRVRAGLTGYIDGDSFFNTNNSRQHFPVTVGLGGNW